MRGPSLYFPVVAGVDTTGFADPLGETRWLVEIADHVTRDVDRFVEAAEQVAFSRDGAVVVGTDGTTAEQTVRVTGREGDGPNDRRGSVDSADWMDTEHLSAVGATVRDGVLAAVTLSEEDGRVSVFRDGGDRRHPPRPARHAVAGRRRLSPDGRLLGDGPERAGRFGRSGIYPRHALHAR